MTVERELVKVTCPIVSGNDNGYVLKYRDQMAVGEKIFVEPKPKATPKATPKTEK